MGQTGNPETNYLALCEERVSDAGVVRSPDDLHSGGVTAGRAGAVRTVAGRAGRAVAGSAGAGIVRAVLAGAVLQAVQVAQLSEQFRRWQVWCTQWWLSCSRWAAVRM